MNNAVLEFLRYTIEPTDIEGRRVLEVGSQDVNGSARSVLEAWNPARYLGVDFQAGRGVDRVMSVGFLCDVLGEESFDVVISTEMLEHVQDWRWAVAQLKRATAAGGLLIVTTRSPGFHYHGYPHDFWRFTESDFAAIFADMETLTLVSDPSEPGVFIVARRPADFNELDLVNYNVATSPEAPKGPLIDHVWSTARNRAQSLMQRVKSR